MSTLAKKAKQWTEWRKKAQPFANGAEAVVFDKKLSYYPKGYFQTRGRVVKTIWLGRSPRVLFLELKIIHALFPKNTPVTHAVRWDSNSEMREMEIHQEMVEVHPLLREYQLAKSGRTLSREERERFAAALNQYIREHGDVARAINRTMDSAGIYSGFAENFSNTSLADPLNPVFFEPKIYDPKRLRAYVNKQPMPEAKRVQLLRWISRLETLQREK